MHTPITISMFVETQITLEKIPTLYTYDIAQFACV